MLDNFIWWNWVFISKDPNQPDNPVNWGEKSVKNETIQNISNFLKYNFSWFYKLHSCTKQRITTESIWRPMYFGQKILTCIIIDLFLPLLEETKLPNRPPLCTTVTCCGCDTIIWFSLIYLFPASIGVLGLFVLSSSLDVISIHNAHLHVISIHNALWGKYTWK